MMLFWAVSTLYILAIVVHLTLLVKVVLYKMLVLQNKWFVFLSVSGILLNSCALIDFFELDLKIAQIICMLMHIFWGAGIFVLLKPYLFPKSQFFTTFRVLLSPILVAVLYLGFELWYQMSANHFLTENILVTNRVAILHLFIYFCPRVFLYKTLNLR